MHSFAVVFSRTRLRETVFLCTGNRLDPLFLAHSASSSLICVRGEPSWTSSWHEVTLLSSHLTQVLWCLVLLGKHFLFFFPFLEEYSWRILSTVSGPQMLGQSLLYPSESVGCWYRWTKRNCSWWWLMIIPAVFSLYYGYASYTALRVTYVLTCNKGV